jgi:hypothetical protein
MVPKMLSSKTNKIVICGDRNWSDFTLIEQVIRQYPKTTEIVEGDCKGADKIAGCVGRKLGYIVTAVSANWSLGLKAGFLRNLYMLNLCPSEILAFHDNIGKSKGTKMMVNIALQRGMPVTVYSHHHPNGEIQSEELEIKRNEKTNTLQS